MTFQNFNIMNYIGHMHLILGIVRNIYGFITPINIMFDTIYLFIFTLLPLSWITFKGECIISYISKKYKNNDYKLGENPYNHADISDLFINNISYNIYYYVSIMIYCGSLIIVNNRSKIVPNYLLNITMFLVMIYVIDNDLKINKYFKLCLSIFLLSIMYNIYLKLSNYKKL